MINRKIMKQAIFAAVLAMAGISCMAQAQPKASDKTTPAGSTEALFPGNKTDWHGYDCYNFKCDERSCLVVVPKTPAKGKPWIWRTMFFGHEPQGDIAMLSNGWHVAFLDVGNTFGNPWSLERCDSFYKLLTEQHGLAKKTVLEGFSRGGLTAYNWAAKHPDNVLAIYGDAPVCDFKSWPGGKGKGTGSGGDWKECLKCYSMTEEQALAYKGNPIDNLEPIAKAKIPLLHVVGAVDKVVPVAENTDIIEKRYKELGGTMKVISKPNCDHHPHSLKDPAPIVEFLLEAWKTGGLNK